MTEEDLAYIRGLTRSKPGVVISGQVVRYRRNQQGNMDTLPMAGIAVTIEGQTPETTETDAKGQYRVEGLPAGEYVVKVSVPEGLSINEPQQKVNVADRGCAVVDFWLEPDGRLSGHVVNPQGLLVDKAGSALPKPVLSCRRSRK
jgi:carboxypeptidase family protein